MPLKICPHCQRGCLENNEYCSTCKTKFSDIDERTSHNFKGTFTNEDSPLKSNITGNERQINWKRIHCLFLDHEWQYFGKLEKRGGGNDWKVGNPTTRICKRCGHVEFKK